MTRAFLACIRMLFMPESQPSVALFVTCLVDLMRPSVGFAALKLLEATGCRVEVPEQQVCCGQPAYNSGDRKGTERIARQVIDAFCDFDYVVAPSGSCAGMLKVHYPQLFVDDEAMRAKATALARKVYELVSFLVDVRGMKKVAASHKGTVTYHDSCSGLREMGVSEQPRTLLRKVKGLKLVELGEGEDCCGFGGTFCVKYSDISNAMVARKTADIAASGAGLVLAGDLGCLLNIAGKLKREGSAVEARHVAEVLAGTTETPAIGSKRR